MVEALEALPEVHEGEPVKSQKPIIRQLPRVDEADVLRSAESVDLLKVQLVVILSEDHNVVVLKRLECQGLLLHGHLDVGVEFLKLAAAGLVSIHLAHLPLAQVEVAPKVRKLTHLRVVQHNLSRT